MATNGSHTRCHAVLVTEREPERATNRPHLGLCFHWMKYATHLAVHLPRLLHLKKLAMKLIQTPHLLYMIIQDQTNALLRILDILFALILK